MKLLTRTLTLFVLIGSLNIGFGQKGRDTAVTVTDDGTNFVLANGIVTAKVEKRSGSLVSLRYKDLELLGAGQGRSNGYWSLPGTSLDFGKKRTAAITQNIVERATVLCNFVYD